MTPEQKTNLVALIQEARANQRKKDKTIAKMLRLVLEVLADPRHEHRAAMATLLSYLITTLEKEEDYDRQS